MAEADVKIPSYVSSSRCWQCWIALVTLREGSASKYMCINFLEGKWYNKNSSQCRRKFVYIESTRNSTICYVETRSENGAHFKCWWEAGMEKAQQSWLLYPWPNYLLLPNWKMNSGFSYCPKLLPQLRRTWTLQISNLLIDYTSGSL